MPIKRLTRYPAYDIMSQQAEWDEHTRRLVSGRLHTSGQYTWLTPVEAELLRALCSLLMDDDRPEVMQFVLDHIDRTMSEGKESHRQPDLPPAPELLRSGLHALDTFCQTMYTKHFFHLDAVHKQSILEELSLGEMPYYDLWSKTPPQIWFSKLLSLTIDAYYSHPEIWSEIGHGGPAYPRGYVRMHPGEPDPWEAREIRRNNHHDQA
ncbi:Gluconate 2-dehydrogenase subunit 3 [Paenibacillus sp. UNCCL117]|uniref:gluconate 2-dehydrogenase subunit 3 family protein n=1 Tax=unclassified Paenibacillus TaxID=185978 RepID=UPI0008832EEE|nr:MULTISPECIES: gluconate 2-dehydrogenase subunit 3 family protein [unclassified Paenibacillus]SDD52903.1 Gluconate 2-dehydrogenase subunit 3 [Paenibacillus sp. cl123]SFW49220.1 Gluconate 2-dehydrogenase subunit 3 [Paenibacillus sp. UNCCL117]